MTTVRQRLNRATVIDMAADLADTYGIDAVSLQRIANDAGVKQPALYRHVTGIEESATLVGKPSLQWPTHGGSLCNNIRVCIRPPTAFPPPATSRLRNRLPRLWQNWLTH